MKKLTVFLRKGRGQVSGTNFLTVELPVELEKELTMRGEKSSFTVEISLGKELGSFFI